VLVLPIGDVDAPAVEATHRRVLARDDLAFVGLGGLSALAARETAGEGEEEPAVEQLLAEARAAFSRFDYAASTSALEEALALLRPRGTTASGRRRLADVHLRLAMVLNVHGEREAAVDQMRACLRLDPACAPDPALHPPVFVALHAEVVAAETSPAERGSITIRSDPTGAGASLDGGPVRPTPVTFEEVAPGPHYLGVSLDGYRTEVELVRVVPGEVTTRSATLRPGPESARAGAALRAIERSGPDATRRTFSEAARLTDAEALLLVDARRRPARITLFDAHGRRVRTSAPLAAGVRDRIERFVEEALPRPGARWYERWWFWTTVAAVVAGTVALSVYFGVRTRDVTIPWGQVVRE
jgi:hypothetical protein